jgi:hypothetical protein
MGKNHQKDLLTCLKQWHDITLKQGEVLAQGDISQFERLNRVSIVLQSRFQNSLEKLEKPELASSDRTLLEEIRSLQAGFIEELERGTEEIAKSIGMLSKNKKSMKGYKQKPPAQPRFKSERT